MFTTTCYKVTNGLLQSAMARLLPPAHVIQYKLRETMLAPKDLPFFCFSTLADARYFVDGNDHYITQPKIFKVLGNQPVIRKTIAMPRHLAEFLASRKSHKATALYTRSIPEGTLFFNEIYLLEDVTPQAVRNLWHND